MAGKAPEVFSQDGSMSIGAWETQETMTPQVIGVRQYSLTRCEMGADGPTRGQAVDAAIAWA